MKVESLYKFFLITPVSHLPVIDETNTVAGLLSKEKILMEMADLSQSGREYERIPVHLFDDTLTENLLSYFQGSRLIPVINTSAEKKDNWDKPRFLAEFSKLSKPVEKPVISKGDQETESKAKIVWFMELMLENFPDALYATDVDGNTIFYNEKFENSVLTRSLFRNSIAFAERYLRDTNRELFANYLKMNEMDSDLKETRAPVLQTYLKNLDLILRIITLKKDEKITGFLYQFILPSNKLSIMDNSGMTFPSIEEAFHNKIPLETILAETESHYIYYSLKRTQENISHAANELGIPRSTLQNRMRQLSVNKRFRRDVSKPIPRNKPEKSPIKPHKISEIPEKKSEVEFRKKKEKNASKAAVTQNREIKKNHKKITGKKKKGTKRK
ncbi:MAG: transcriptional regulator [Leptospira sp.]|nr:transcriptional regulator [Leptospira sp.]